MTRLFEIPWLGGAAEDRYRALRPDIASLPWGTIDVSRYPADLVELARVHWTHSAIGEYRAAASFAQVLALLLLAGAPLDLVGMASDFVTDEIAHTELAARLAAELGGGAPFALDRESLTAPLTAPLPERSSAGSLALRRANAAVVRVGCVMETFSKILMTAILAADLHPLIRAVFETIARDEARHARFGWHYLGWAAPDLDDEDRAELAAVAERALRDIAPLSGLRVEGPLGVELGLIGVGDFPERAVREIRAKILVPLAGLGIVVSDEARREILTLTGPETA